MPLTDAELAREVALEAGELVLALRRDFGDYSDRDDARRLRDAGDRGAEDLIAARLLAERPDDVVLSEEAPDDTGRLTAERLWIIDPLDGTWEYGQGRNDFAVHIALWQRGELVAGTVALPARGRVHSADQPDVVPDVLPTDRPIRIAVSRSRPPRALPQQIKLLEVATGLSVERLEVGSAGAKTAEVLEGRADLYLHDAGMSEWDVAAPAAVAVAAGLRVCHLDGSPLTFNNFSPKVGDMVLGLPSLVALLLGDSLRRE